MARLAIKSATLAMIIVASFSVRPLFALDQVNVHISAGISPNTLLYRCLLHTSDAADE